MSLWEQNRHEKAADARIEATQAAHAAKARAKPPETDYRSERFACRTDGARPVGGYSPTMPLDQVMGLSAKRDGLVWARTQEGLFIPFCGPNCLATYERAVERGSAPPVVRINIIADDAPRPEPRTWGQDHRDKMRDADVSCARCRCKPGIVQTLGDDGEWRPNATELARMLVSKPHEWRLIGSVFYCSRTCAELSGRVVPMASRTLPPLGGAQGDLARQRAEIARAHGLGEPGAGVTEIADKSYQRRLAAPVGPKLENREVPDGRPARPKPTPKGER